MQKRRAYAVAAAVSIVAAAAWWASTRRESLPASESSSASRQPWPGHYIGRKACTECHAAEAAAWSGSDHDRAMEPAVDSTVLGNFDGDSLHHHGMVSRFYRKGKGFFVHTEGPDGVPGEFQVKYTFGVKPLQQYLVEFPGGRMQSLTLAWDTGKKRWFHLYPDRRIAPDDWLHWTRDGQNWNGMCADCHSTGLRRGYDAATNTFATTWKEIDVSCEACHGPGSEHAAYAKSNRLFRRLSGHGKADHYGLAADHMSGDSATNAEVMACARCHGRRMALQADFTYAREFLDEYAPELLRENIYHADGQIQDENYEYGSFLQSRMFHQGVRCSNCHDPHSLKTRAPGNDLCTRCHEPARFDVPVHHRHAAGSAGSRCIECHMPAKYYMQVDLRRDHSLRVPRPDLSVRFGTPNACNDCHSKFEPDRGPAWAAEWVVKWHGPDRKPHFSELLALGRAGGPGADSALARLAENPDFPGIARASALALLSDYMGVLAGGAQARGVPAHSALVQGTRDPDPLVRRAAAIGLEQVPNDVRIPALLPLLADSRKAVRAAAAQALVTASPLLPDSTRTAFGKAMGEYREALDANAYFPGGRFNQAQLHEKLGQADSAVEAYTKALELDNRLVPARINLAQLYDRLGRPRDAETHFREALRLNPEYPETPYFLGLLLAGQGRLDTAAFYMAMAAERVPGNARIHYNHGLLLQKLGRPVPAEKALAAATRLAPRDPDYPYTLAWFYSTLDRWEKVEPLLLQVAALAPDYPGLAALARETAARLARAPR